jgi:hypothetical protein
MGSGSSGVDTGMDTSMGMDPDDPMRKITELNQLLR